MICFTMVIFIVQGLCAQTVTRFPSLLLHASSRGMGMGDAGIASSDGVDALLYNPARSAFMHYRHEGSVGYMPWLTGISADTRMLSAAYANSNDNGTWGIALSYLRLGSMDTRDENGATLANYTAREFHVGGSYAIRLNEHHALSTTLRLLSQEAFDPNPVSVVTVCGDVGYSGFAELGQGTQALQWGVTLSNLGAGRFNLPATAAVGIGFKAQGDHGTLTTAIDASRLLKDNWNGLWYHAGMEYGYDEQFFLRGGIAFENTIAGNRKFISIGSGYKGYVSDQSWHIDVHYLVPFGNFTGVSPFQSNWGLTLGIQIGNTL